MLSSCSLQQQRLLWYPHSFQLWYVMDFWYPMSVSLISMHFSVPHPYASLLPLSPFGPVSIAMCGCKSEAPSNLYNVWMYRLLMILLMNQHWPKYSLKALYVNLGSLFRSLFRQSSCYQRWFLSVRKLRLNHSSPSQTILIQAVLLWSQSSPHLRFRKLLIVIHQPRTALCRRPRLTRGWMYLVLAALLWAFSDGFLCVFPLAPSSECMAVWLLTSISPALFLIPSKTTGTLQVSLLAASAALSLSIGIHHLSL